MSLKAFAAAVELVQVSVPNAIADVWPAGEEFVRGAEITAIFICNHTGSAATFRLCHDFDGGGAPTLDQTTALFWDITIAANSTEIIPAESAGLGIPLSANSVLGAQASAASTLTLTVYGVPEDVGERQ